MKSYRHLVLCLLVVSVLTGLVLLALKARDDYRRLDPDNRKASALQ